MIPIHFGAVLLAAAVSIVLGFLWYGPLFGKAWLSTIAVTPEQIAAAKAKGMGKIYLLNIISSIIMAFVMAHAFLFGTAYTGITGIAGVFNAAFWNWLGFVAPVLLGAVLWEGKSWKWWRILAGYYLVSLFLQAVVFSLF